MADAPHAFLSYTRRDDDFHRGAITALRKQLELGVQVVTGQEFKIFQDVEGIAFGKHWPSRMDEALKQARFLIPIVTPTFFVRPICREELVRFLEYEKASGRRDRILPIYFVKIRDLEQRKARDELVREVSEREWEEWLDYADLAADDHRLRPAIRRVAERIAERIEEAIVAFEVERTPSSPLVTVLPPVTPAPPSTSQPAGAGKAAAAPSATTEPAPSSPTRAPIAGASLPTPSPLVGEGGGGGYTTGRKATPHPTSPARGEEHEGARDERRRATTPAILRPAIVRPRDTDLRPGTIFRDIEAPWCPEMVVVPAGEFVMGSSEDEVERSGSEGPQHLVRVPSFALGRYPVTFEEYDRFCERTGREKPEDEGWGRGRMPVINVSWEDAQAYCRWLSGETGRTYRLPSEAEWEYACRAGTTTRYSWGDAFDKSLANATRESTSVVRHYPANAWGLFDMHGNVWEWCEDVWHESYAGAPADGSAWLEGGDPRTWVVRGGSWCDAPGPRLLRSAGRVGLRSGFREFNLGFRVSRTLTP